MIYLELTYSFFMIGAFSFGGGYAMIPLIERELVQKQAWLTAYQFVDLLAIAEITPGPMAINAATFAGHTVAGVLGAIAANLGLILPSLFSVITLAYIYVRIQGNPSFSGSLSAMRPVAAALVLVAAIKVGGQTLVDLRSAAIAFVVLLLMLRTKLNPILLLVGAGIAGIIIF